MRKDLIILFVFLNAFSLNLYGRYIPTWRINDTLELFSDYSLSGKSIWNLPKGIRHSKTHKVYIDAKYYSLTFYSNDVIIAVNQQFQFGIIDINNNKRQEFKYSYILFDKKTRSFTVYQHNTGNIKTDMESRYGKGKYFYFNHQSNFKAFFTTFYGIRYYGITPVFGDIISILDENLLPVFNDNFIVSDTCRLRTVLKPSYSDDKRIWASYHLIKGNKYMDLGDTLLWADFDSYLKRFGVPSGVGVINGSGTIVIAPEYDSIIIQPFAGTIHCIRGDAHFFYSLKGELLLKTSGDLILKNYPEYSYVELKSPLILEKNKKLYFSDSLGNFLTDGFDDIRFVYSLWPDLGSDTMSIYAEKFIPSMRSKIFFDCREGDTHYFLNDRLDTIFNNYDELNSETYLHPCGPAFIYSVNDKQNFYFPGNNSCWNDSVTSVHYDDIISPDKIYLTTAGGKIFHYETRRWRSNTDLPVPEDFDVIFLEGKAVQEKNIKGFIELGFGNICMIDKNNIMKKLNDDLYYYSDAHYMNEKKLIRSYDIETTWDNLKFLELGDGSIAVYNKSKDNNSSDGYYLSEVVIPGKADRIKPVSMTDHIKYMFYRNGKVILGDPLYGYITKEFYYDSLIIPETGHAGYLAKRNNKWLYVYNSFSPRYSRIGKYPTKRSGFYEDVYFECDSFKIINEEFYVIEYYNNGKKYKYDNEFYADHADNPDNIRNITSDPDTLLRQLYDSLCGIRSKKEIIYLSKNTLNKQFISGYVLHIDSLYNFECHYIYTSYQEPDNFKYQVYSRTYFPNYEFLRNYQEVKCPEYFESTSDCPFKFCYEDNLFIEFIKPDGTKIKAQYSTALDHVLDRRNRELSSYLNQLRYVTDIRNKRMTYR